MVQKLMHQLGFRSMSTRSHGQGYIKEEQGPAGHVALFPGSTEGKLQLDSPVTVFHYDESWEMRYEERHDSLRDYLESTNQLSEAPPGKDPKGPFHPVRFIEPLDWEPGS